MTELKQDKFKLSGEHKEFVINKLALHCGVTEIAESLKIDFDIDITPQGISHYKREWEKEWRERRDFLNKHIAEIEPFADKVNRMKMRGDLVRDLNDNLWQEEPLIKNNRTIRDDDNNPIMIKGFPNHGTMNKLLDSMQKESEPDKLALTNPEGTEPYGGFTDDEKRMERLIQICDSIRERRDSKDSK